MFFFFFFILNTKDKSHTCLAVSKRPEEVCVAQSECVMFKRQVPGLFLSYFQVPFCHSPPFGACVL